MATFQPATKNFYTPYKSITVINAQLSCYIIVQTASKLYYLPTFLFQPSTTNPQFQPFLFFSTHPHLPSTHFHFQPLPSKGPDTWWVHFPSASGSHQSPIDIITEECWLATAENSNICRCVV